MIYHTSPHIFCLHIFNNYWEHVDHDEKFLSVTAINDRLVIKPSKLLRLQKFCSIFL